MSAREAGERTALEREMRAGLAEAADPLNDAALRGGGAVTTARSWWFAQPCPACGHTFRVNDPVEVAPDRHGVTHAASEGYCAGGAGPPDAERARLASDLLAGLAETWPPPGAALRLPPQHRLVSPPPGFPRPRCAICKDTFRPGEVVLVCPCRPDAPLCRAAAHCDALHNRPCVADWSPGRTQTRCPLSSAELRPRG